LHYLGIWSYGGVWFAFGLVPILDVFIEEDSANPSKAQYSRLTQEFKWRLIPALWVPTQYAICWYAAYVYSTSELKIYEYVGIVVSVGILSGAIGINVAHELIHKPSSWERFLGRLLLAGVWYGHWANEHLYGHHRLVSTPYDPATSKLGENFYQFWFRSVTGTWASARAMEARRLRNTQGIERVLSDAVFQSVLSSLAVAYVFYLTLGNSGLVFFFLQAPVAFSMLEAVNYIEHYGLYRKPRANAPAQSVLKKAHDEGNYAMIDGAYETVSPFHSWNAQHTVTNYLLLKLQRHSDHHANASRRYQVLRTFLASPQLPTGYSGCILMALIPPVWFYMMDHRVRGCHERIALVEKSGVNVFSEEFDAEARRLGSVESALAMMTKQQQQQQQQHKMKKRKKKVVS